MWIEREEVPDGGHPKAEEEDPAEDRRRGGEEGAGNQGAREKASSETPPGVPAGTCKGCRSTAGSWNLSRERREATPEWQREGRLRPRRTNRFRQLSQKKRKRRQPPRRTAESLPSHPRVYRGTGHSQCFLEIANVLIEAFKSFHILWCQLEIKNLPETREGQRLARQARTGSWAGASPRASRAGGGSPGSPCVPTAEAGPRPPTVAVAAGP